MPVKVVVIVDEVRNVGKRGDTREISERDAKILVAIGKVALVNAPQEVAPKAEKVVAKPPRKGYRRSDMRSTQAGDPVA